jgi:hypothetical protein
MVMAIVAAALSTTAWAGQPLETESARLVKRGTFEFESGVERQSSSAGTETAIPFALVYGITDRLEILVEPVLYNSIHDKGVPPQKGIGDVEGTMTAVLSRERAHLPAFAIAGEVKVPTAHNTRIGSGKADYTVYAIGSKRAGRWDTHLNFGYTVIGRPAGTQVNNVRSFGLAEEFHGSDRYELVGEIFGSTAALAETADQPNAGQESQLTPEIGGGELVGAIGMRYHVDGGVTCSLGVTYDNNHAVLLHPGLTVRW